MSLVRAERVQPDRGLKTRHAATLAPFGGRLSLKAPLPLGCVAQTSACVRVAWALAGESAASVLVDPRPRRHSQAWRAGVTLSFTSAGVPYLNPLFNVSWTELADAVRETWSTSTARSVGSSIFVLYKTLRPSRRCCTGVSWGSCHADARMSWCRVNVSWPMPHLSSSKNCVRVPLLRSCTLGFSCTIGYKFVTNLDTIACPAWRAMLCRSVAVREHGPSWRLSEFGTTLRIDNPEDAWFLQA